MPVVGIGEAAFHMASLVAGKFSVVTTLSRSVPAIEHNLVRYGLASRCAKVRASDVPVLELEVPGSNARGKISEEIKRAIRDDRAEAIVLGCAGMADLAAAACREHGLPVLDGVACAVRLCESLVGLGLVTSKRGGYQVPRGKSFAGIFAPFSPSGRVGEQGLARHDIGRRLTANRREGAECLQIVDIAEPDVDVRIFAETRCCRRRREMRRLGLRKR